MKKRWMTVCCAVLFAILVMAATDTKAADEAGIWNQEAVETYTEGTVTYHIHPSLNGEAAWVYKIEIQGKVKDLSVPETILGKRVTRLGCPEFGSEEEDLDEAYATLFGTYMEPWHNWDGSNAALSALKTIQLPDTVEVIDRSAFSGLDSVTELRLPKNVKEIQRYTFFGCGKLKTIVLPEQLESFENSSLWGCPSLKKIKISKKNQAFQVKGNCLIRKKDKALILAVTGGKKFTIPGGVKKITAYAFGGTKSPAIHIPASVSKIEKAAFNRDPWKMNSNIKDVTVSKKSKAYARDGQCIYKKSDKSLTIAISNKKGEVRISERVEKLTPDISLVNCAGLKEDPSEGILKRVVFPSKLKHVIVPAFDAFEADEVYFTGSVPPKVTWSKSADEDADALPSGSQVYVPKASAKAYKKWYKKHKCFEYLERRDLFHTYNPGAAF